LSPSFYKITERLKVRSFQDIDSNDFLLLLTNPLVNIFLGGSRFLSNPHLVKQFLRQMSLDHSGSNPWLLYSIFNKNNHQLIGGCGIKTELKNQKAEIFYLLFPSYWGQGFAVEACRPLLENAINQFGLQKVYALILPENIRAQRVAEKLGFKYFKMVNLGRYKRKEKVQQWILFPI
jgi:[ribosomal protein S5]-alanine N-acetyltransferase